MYNPFVILSCAEATIALVFTRQLTRRHAYLPPDCGSDFILHKICSSSLLGRREDKKIYRNRSNPRNGSTKSDKSTRVRWRDNQLRHEFGYVTISRL